MEPFKVSIIKAEYTKNDIGGHFPTEHSGVTDYIIEKVKNFESIACTLRETFSTCYLFCIFWCLLRWSTSLMSQHFTVLKILILPLNGSLASMHINFEEKFQLRFLWLSIQVFDIVTMTNTLIFLQINDLPGLLIIQYFHWRSIFLRGEVSQMWIRVTRWARVVQKIDEKHNG